MPRPRDRAISRAAFACILLFQAAGLLLIAPPSYGQSPDPYTAPPQTTDPASPREMLVSTTPMPVTLETLVQRVTEGLPANWKVVETGRGTVPIGWDGPEEGLYVMVEDTRTRFFHPNGFHYFSFYRVWIMPSEWEGEMRRTPYVTDSAPAYLLGVDDDFVAFYHTAGGNVWPDGPQVFCRTLGVDELCHTNTSRRTIDLACEERLMEHDTPDDALMRDRIIGLTGGDTALYMEYVFGSGEGRPVEELDELTARLAGDVFAAFPDVESLYLRRCTSDTFTDTIVAR